MPLVAAQCTNCGAALQVDDAKDAAVCQYCGSAFIVEKAIQNFEIHNSYQISNANIIINDEKSVENRLAAADKYLNQLNDYDNAYATYAEVEKYAPDNFRVWYGKLASATCGFDADTTAQKLVKSFQREFSLLKKDITNAKKTVPEEQADAFDEKITNFLKECQESIRVLASEIQAKKDKKQEEEKVTDDEIKNLQERNQQLRNMNIKDGNRSSRWFGLNGVLEFLRKVAMVCAVIGVLLGVLAIIMAEGRADYWFTGIFCLVAGVLPFLVFLILEKAADNKGYATRNKIRQREKEMNSNDNAIQKANSEKQNLIKQMDANNEKIEQYRSYMDAIEKCLLQ